MRVDSYSHPFCPLVAEDIGDTTPLLHATVVAVAAAVASTVARLAAATPARQQVPLPHSPRGAASLAACVRSPLPSLSILIHSLAASFAAVASISEPRYPHIVTLTRHPGPPQNSLGLPKRQ